MTTIDTTELQSTSFVSLDSSDLVSLESELVSTKVAEITGKPRIGKKFKKERIDLDALNLLSEHHLKAMGVSSLGDRLKIQNWAQAEHSRKMSSSIQSSTHQQQDQDLSEEVEADQTASTLARSPTMEDDTFSSTNMGDETFEALYRSNNRTEALNNFKQNRAQDV